jgi:hypothetical protein
VTEHDQDDAPEYLDDHDGMTTDDLFTADELREYEQATEARLDAEQEARDAREVEAAQQPYDIEPWLGYADGDER